MLNRLNSSLVSDKSELHITLSNFQLDGKMALQIAYFCPHGQGQEHVSQPCATHGHATQPCVLWGTL
ncbi:putative porphobilinogen deaminase [Gossypium arboreum]|uniref:Putative porphobilinogen deaminase n=1 Tax=Gossypium arboreum TaxID=29729 RepID=A0A0B0PIK6_GOSAR|nr:putative porphobilinogen deaminase [Gossypium arboreum]